MGILEDGVTGPVLKVLSAGPGGRGSTTLILAQMYQTDVWIYSTRSGIVTDLCQAQPEWAKMSLLLTQTP